MVNNPSTDYFHAFGIAPPTAANYAAVYGRGNPLKREMLCPGLSVRPCIKKDGAKGPKRLESGYVK